MKDTYEVCHTCQRQKVLHCAHPEECGGTKIYPRELKEMFISEYNNNVPLSIICEKAFDMGKKFNL